MRIRFLNDIVNIRRFIRYYNDNEIFSFTDLLNELNCNNSDRNQIRSLLLIMSPSIVEKINFVCIMILGAFNMNARINRSAKFILNIIKYG